MSTVAVVTGAGRGIGRDIALQLSRQGVAVMLGARSAEQLEAVHAEIAGAGGRSAYQATDVRKVAHVQELFRQCDQQLGTPNVLINNAGLGQFISLALTTDAIWQETLDTNLTGSFLCCREVLPYFEKAGGGLIINNASIAAVRGFPNFAAYCASKAGLLGLSNALREELRAQNIRVTVVLPGATDTPFWDHVAGEWNRDMMISSEHVAKLIATVVLQPPGLQVEEIRIMPVGGAL